MTRTTRFVMRGSLLSENVMAPSNFASRPPMITLRTLKGVLGMLETPDHKTKNSLC